MPPTGPARAECAHGPGGRTPADGPESSTRDVSAWPLRSSLELGALPSAVPCARLHTRLVLAEWRLKTQAETAELLVSELVSNGVQASEGMIGCRYRGRWTPSVPPVRLWLCSDRQSVLVQV